MLVRSQGRRIGNSSRKRPEAIVPCTQYCTVPAWPHPTGPALLLGVTRLQRHGHPPRAFVVVSRPSVSPSSRALKLTSPPLVFPLHPPIYNAQQQQQQHSSQTRLLLLLKPCDTTSITEYIIPPLLAAACCPKVSNHPVQQQNNSSCQVPLCFLLPSLLTRLVHRQRF